MDIAPQILPSAGVVLCGRNETRERYTHYIRHDIMNKHSKLPDMGEKLICRINNWTLESGGINLTNGLTGRVLNQPDVSTFDGKCFYIDFLPDLNPVPFTEIPVDYEFFTTDFTKRQQMKNFKFYTGEGFEFGYVQTVHVAQGSQWKTGVYFEEYMPMDMNKLNYTALSRFSNKCIYVKKNRKYW